MTAVIWREVFRTALLSASRPALPTALLLAAAAERRAVLGREQAIPMSYARCVDLLDDLHAWLACDQSGPAQDRAQWALPFGWTPR